MHAPLTLEPNLVTRQKADIGGCRPFTTSISIVCVPIELCVGVARGSISGCTSPVDSKSCFLSLRETTQDAFWDLWWREEEGLRRSTKAR